MAGKSGEWAQQEPKTVQVGYIHVIEPSYQVQPWDGQESNSFQRTSKNSIVDKQTGNSMRTTLKDSGSTGDVFKGRSTGRYGYNDEYKTTFTTKIGDKSGYYEQQQQQG